ncbi:MAG TPA: hypothetical protein VN426_03495 [Syntrophomonadaceae bacterium]|nr:hypothetical protein [Syntrophomonadaceae bacterium]
MNIALTAGLGVAAGALCEGILMVMLLRMLTDAGAVRENFLGHKIPISLGISFPVSVMLTYLLYGICQWYQTSYHLFIVGLLAAALLGFIDDMLGARDTLGFRGHFGALRQGRLTTGGLKALGGGTLALFLAFFHGGGLADIILNTLIIALFTNALNLFDLRPGRAIKVFLFFLAIIIVVGRTNSEFPLLAPLVGAVLCYFPLDLRARAMMGDAGSNVLGMVVGYTSILSLSLAWRCGFLGFLILLHIYTEKYSLSQTIERYSLLRAIDQLGRGPSHGKRTTLG